ncbi:hypothetical protein BLL41_18835 [Bacillus sp. FMQ74]|nr:hypothetical protein BLL41_18835 [Bacillus sp. FMQ74]
MFQEITLQSLLINKRSNNTLVPAGYDLAIHGIVISRTLMIAFTLYLVSKLGYFLLNKKD